MLIVSGISKETLQGVVNRLTATLPSFEGHFCPSWFPVGSIEKNRMVQPLPKPGGRHPDSGAKPDGRFSVIRLLSTVACVKRTMAPVILGRFARVTMSVQPLQIVVALLPALSFWNAMIDFERILLRKVQPTRTASVLVVCAGPCHAGADGRMTAQAYLQYTQSLSYGLRVAWTFTWR